MAVAEFSPSQFVAVFNQTLEMAYPSVVITGELANFRVSKRRWLYFDLKDEIASLHCFGTVYQLPGPLEDGMLVRVTAQPRLHPLYGFSLNIVSIRPSGEGSIKRAADLLKIKLAAEGLFDPARKRLIPYPPNTIGLITSAESAAYSDFLKVIGQRWGGLKIELIDVQVQGESAIEQIVEAIQTFNQLVRPPDVLVLIRGGGSPEDLAAFSSEPVTRAVAASRVPTLVAIGHERDICLAELAADRRSSTPTHAAEVLVPERSHQLRVWQTARQHMSEQLMQRLDLTREELIRRRQEMFNRVDLLVKEQRRQLDRRRELINILNPEAVLQRGYALVRAASGRLISSIQGPKIGDIVEVVLRDGRFNAQVKTLQPGGKERRSINA